MSMKWLRREGERWMNDGIVTREQLERIQALYAANDRSVGVLPVLGGLLLGLGILSLVAANWQLLPNLVRIALILLLMIGCYGIGGRLVTRGHPNLGVAIVGIGLFAFGGGIVLIEQMFHIVPFSALPIVVWAAAGAALTYVFNSRYLFFLSLIIVTVAQSYSLSAFDAVSIPGLVVLTTGLVPYMLRFRRPAITALWSLTFIIHAMMLIISESWDFGWFFVSLLLLYTAGDFLATRYERISMQIPPLAAAFIFGLAAALFHWGGHTHWATDMQAAPAVYLPILAAALLVSAYAKFKRGEKGAMPDWLLFAPALYLPSAMVSVAYLILLFVYSLVTLIQGYASESRAQINIGTGLFLAATMAAYFKITWAFMDKSLFFLVGGALLLGLSWLLNRRKRLVIGGKKEE